MNVAWLLNAQYFIPGRKDEREAIGHEFGIVLLQDSSQFLVEHVVRLIGEMQSCQAELILVTLPG